MKRTAVIFKKTKRITFCVDTQFQSEFLQYFFFNDSTSNKSDKYQVELSTIFELLAKGCRTPKYGKEQINDKCVNITAMKPFLGKENDRIICKEIKESLQPKKIVLVELHRGKKNQHVDKKLKTNYIKVGGYTYEKFKDIKFK